MKRILCILMVVALMFSVSILPLNAASETGLMLTFLCYDCGNAILPSYWMTSDLVSIVCLSSYLAFKNSDMDTIYTIEYEEFYCPTCKSLSVVGFQLRSTGDLFYLNSDYPFVDIDPYEPESLLVIFEKPIQGIITGEPVPNAEYYQLYEKIGTEYVLVRTDGKLEFDLNEVVKEPGHDSPGDYTFVVKACAEGYESSDYSNEVVYTVK